MMEPVIHMTGSTQQPKPLDNELSRQDVMISELQKQVMKLTERLEAALRPDRTEQTDESAKEGDTMKAYPNSPLVRRIEGSNDRLNLSILKLVDIIDRLDL